MSQTKVKAETFFFKPATILALSFYFAAAIGSVVLRILDQHRKI